MRGSPVWSLTALTGLFLIALVPAALAQKTTQGSGEFVNKGGRSMAYCRNFAIANKCRPGWDIRNQTCICRGR